MADARITLGSSSVLALALSLSACGGNSFATGNGDSGPGADASTDGTLAFDASDDTTSDAASGDDAPPPADGAFADAGTDAPPATYNDVTDPTKGQLYAIGTNPEGGVGGSMSYWAGGFDGRYVYYSPLQNSVSAFSGLLTRFDTQKSFINATAWSAFDLSAVNANAVGFSGVEFDGRYVYLVPYHSTAFSGMVARYDSQASFSNASSFDVFDMSAINVGAKGFAGGAFDGRYVYFAPYSSTNKIAVRFDSTGSFGSAGAWAGFDVTTVSPKAGGRST